jgi:hypothetical protein
MQLLLTEPVLLALIGGVTSNITLLLTLIMKKLVGMHKQFNSRMDQLLTLTKAQGNKEGRAELTKEQSGK